MRDPNAPHDGGQDVWRPHPAAEAFPMLGDDELAELAEDIKANGLREPVWLYDDPERGRVLLDGRNRLAACERAGVEPTTRVYRGDHPTDFVVSMNVNRRHMTAGQKAAAAAALEPLYAEEARKRQAQAAAATNRRRWGADSEDKSLPADRQEAMPPDGDAPEDRRQRESTSKAASQVGASGRSTARYKRVNEQAPDLAEKVREGSMALDRAERIIRDREAEQRRIAEAKREAEQAGQPTALELRTGDFRDVLADLRDVDAIITDPPYEADALDLLDGLAEWSDKVLADDGVLVVLFGQTHLPEAYRRLAGYRPYRWTGCYLTSGPAYASHARRVQSQWKPLLVYGGGPRFSDTFHSTGDDKQHHRWGQNYDAFHRLVETFTRAGDTVVDPFAGGGTTLLAAHALGRHAYGAEIDPHEASKALDRLEVAA